MQENNTYTARAPKLAGRRYQAIQQAARAEYNAIASQSKRNPYVRSIYFNKEKVFLGVFWEHLSQKTLLERKRRLEFYPCAIELLRHSRCSPQTIIKTAKPSEILHRFSGKTITEEIFFVQVKEDTRTGNKYFMSVFPRE